MIRTPKKAHSLIWMVIFLIASAGTSHNLIANSIFLQDSVLADSLWGASLTDIKVNDESINFSQGRYDLFNLIIQYTFEFEDSSNVVPAVSYTPYDTSATIDVIKASDT